MRIGTLATWPRNAAFRCPTRSPTSGRRSCTRLTSGAGSGSSGSTTSPGPASVARPLRRLVREAAEDDAAEGSRWLELQVEPSSYAPHVGGITPALEISSTRRPRPPARPERGSGVVVAASRIRHPSTRAPSRGWPSGMRVRGRERWSGSACRTTSGAGRCRTSPPHSSRPARGPGPGPPRRGAAWARLGRRHAHRVPARPRRARRTGERGPGGPGPRGRVRA